MKCAITISYNGAEFFGLQSQKNGEITVIGTIEKALKKIKIDSKIVASGRTDRGVHATAQVCHIDLPPYWDDLEKLKYTLNKILPQSIHIKKVEQKDDSFHARYSAKRRVYRYIIKEGTTNPFQEKFISFLESVDFKKIEQNIKLFLGEHDFRYFMKSGSDVKSTIRTIFKAFAYRYKGYIILNFEANGFLRTQIRLMVAALLSLNDTQIIELLQCRKKYKLKPADGNGLYLAKVKY